MEQLKFESEITQKELRSVSRKPFVISDINGKRTKQEELAVFTCAKKLAEYVFLITEKSPKKYRWNIISKLQNKAVEIVEFLYQANFEKDDERLFFQKKAGVHLRLLDFYAETAQKMQAITLKQTFQIAKQILEVRKLLGGWSKIKNKKGLE